MRLFVGILINLAVIIGLFVLLPTHVFLSVLGVIAFILAVLFSIGLHEVGHLVPAKKFGVKVTQYMIGFGPTLWSRQKGETEYGIKGIPLGGYIRMVGMMPPAKPGHVDKGPFANVVTSARDNSQSEIQPGEEDRAFYKLNPGRKSIVMLGGPTMNLVLAIVFMFIALGVIGIPQTTNTVGTVVACVPTAAHPTGDKKDGTCVGSTPTPAAAAGLKAGDVIVSVNGKPASNWDSVSNAIVSSGGGSVPVVVNRAGQELTLTADLVEITHGSGTKQTTRPFLGISPQVELVRQPWTQVPAQAWTQIKGTVVAIVTLPVRVYEIGKAAFTNQPRDPQGLVGLVGVARVSAEVASAPAPAAWRVSEFFMIIGGLNLALFMFNLIPLLPLDGGHVAGAAYEAIRNRVAKRRGQPSPGPADVARLLPIAYVVAIGLIAMSALILYADIVKPLRIN